MRPPAQRKNKIEFRRHDPNWVEKMQLFTVATFIVATFILAGINYWGAQAGLPVKIMIVWGHWSPYTPVPTPPNTFCLHLRRPNRVTIVITSDDIKINVYSIGWM